MPAASSAPIRAARRSAASASATMGSLTQTSQQPAGRPGALPSGHRCERSAAAGGQLRQWRGGGPAHRRWMGGWARRVWSDPHPDAAGDKVDAACALHADRSRQPLRRELRCRASIASTATISMRRPASLTAGDPPFVGTASARAIHAHMRRISADAHASLYMHQRGGHERDGLPLRSRPPASSATRSSRSARCRAGAADASWSTAELILHPSGRFLYGSNRGHDSIVAYRVDEQGGRLDPDRPHVDAGPDAARLSASIPSGRWLLVGNQDSDSIVAFAVDPQTGALSPTGATDRAGGTGVLPVPDSGAVNDEIITRDHRDGGDGRLEDRATVPA
jgi:hypothetical protein